MNKEKIILTLGIILLVALLFFGIKAIFTKDAKNDTWIEGNKTDGSAYGIIVNYSDDIYQDGGVYNSSRDGLNEDKKLGYYLYKTDKNCLPSNAVIQVYDNGVFLKDYELLCENNKIVVKTQEEHNSIEIVVV